MKNYLSPRTLLSMQKVRFLIAGSLNTALDFLLLNVMALAGGLPVLLANGVSVTVGITVSYALNHYFVFRYPSRISLKKFAQFFLVTGFSSLILQSLIIWGFEVFFDTTYGNSLLFLGTTGENHFLAINIAKAVAVLVGLIWNFCMYKFVVFRQTAVAAEADVDGTVAASAVAPLSR